MAATKEHDGHTIDVGKPHTIGDLTDQAKATAEAQPLVAKPSLAAALVAALADLNVVKAGRTAKVEMKQGGSYSYDYADLGDLVKLTRPVLASHGLVALTPVYGRGNGLTCVVTILHTSGERLDLGSFDFPQGRDAQATGSMTTYHRRYALAAALGLAVGEDDDGASAKPREPEVVWNAATVKQNLVELCGGDKAKAALVWRESEGDDTPSFGPDTARLMLDFWEHAPAEGSEPEAAAQ